MFSLQTVEISIFYVSCQNIKGITQNNKMNMILIIAQRGFSLSVCFVTRLLNLGVGVLTHSWNLQPIRWPGDLNAGSERNVAFSHFGGINSGKLGALKSAMEKVFCMFPMLFRWHVSFRRMGDYTIVLFFLHSFFASVISNL